MIRPAYIFIALALGLTLGVGAEIIIGVACYACRRVLRARRGFRRWRGG